MKGLTIDKKAKCISTQYAGIYTWIGVKYSFIIHVIQYADHKPCIESLEWVNEAPDKEDIDDEICYYFSTKHKYDIC